MVFSSTHIRLTRTTSDLRILSAILLPPSPVLRADNSLISSTSGEIPILLEATAHVCDSPHRAFAKPLGLCDDVKESKRNNKFDAPMNKLALTCSGEAALKDRTRKAPDDMCITAEPPSSRHETESSGDSYAASAASVELKNGKHPTYGNVGRSSIPSDCSSAIFGRQGDFIQTRDLRAFHPHPMELRAAGERDLDGDQMLMIATFHTYSTLPTPTFAPPSPSPSADVISPFSPVGRQRQRRPLERARAVRLPGRPRSPRLQLSEAEADSVRNVTSPANRASSHRWQLADSAPTAPTHSHLADTHVSDLVHPFVNHVVLPEELLWLKHMIIELWIDQEGFRAVRPSMQLVGYSPRSRSLHPYDSAENAMFDVTAGVAEFMPTKREAFAFHYATLDSPPALRMVAVAGDESRDYISRQATLSVKANGVYTVIGTEAFVAPTLNSDAHGSRLQNVRLRWKLDYFVCDRKVDGIGKTIPGEKTLTPLTFSCSPYLFHPSQGKKAGLMHIMKKNLAQKLASQKLEPPIYEPSRRGMPPQASQHLSTAKDAAAHARSRSDASAKSRLYSLNKPPLDVGVKGATQGTNHTTRAHRRRASSAGQAA